MADSSRSSFGRNRRFPLKARPAAQGKQRPGVMLKEAKPIKPSLSVPESEFFKNISKMNKKALEIVSGH
ncbi:hypothetical protein LRR81_18175 [Metabacillus sp. GX 13764]|uniref:hypothetical protein n=1 Tax=Metabacillus kandeliae TaxID=2900151 RepID=UPI001E4DD498|nr:hypothetical protein [Metabacillus kandeliae]MCD7036173.1 hypothetical protein [Metabacillus kandeliae]